jgi:hypothetical protein
MPCAPSAGGCQARSRVKGSHSVQSRTRLRCCGTHEVMYPMDPTNCQNKQLAELGRAPATRGGRGTLPHGRLASDASRACHRAQLAQHIAQHAQREMPHALVVPAQQGAGGAL